MSDFNFDLDSLFANIKKDRVAEEQKVRETAELNNKRLEDMSEEEKEQFYNSKDFKEYGTKSETFESTTDINYDGKNVQEIFKLSGDTNRFSYNCFDFVESDKEDYEYIVEFSPEMQETLRRGEILLPTFKYLHQDIFMSLYRHDAVILPPEKMHIQSYMNRNILSKLVNTPVYIALRKACRTDMFNAGIGTEIIGEQVINILKDEMKKIKDFEQKRQALERLIEQEEKLDSLSEEIEELEELLEEKLIEGATREELEALQQQIGNKELSLNEARTLAEQMSMSCEELVDAGDDEIVEDVSIRMDNTITDATAEVQEISKYVQAWGLGEGSRIKVPFNMKRDIVERIRNSEKLKKFTDIIGRYKECAIAEQKKKESDSKIEIKSVKTSNKIEDALPSETIKFCNDTLKKDIMLRMTQGQLISYDKESQKQKNKGPIIVCLDMSGSMGGNKEMWAKALSVGILEIAQRQKREFACIPYQHSVMKKIIIHKDEINPDKIISIADLYASGGTNFEAPLREASELIEESTFKEADIVFITDGDCSISSDFKRKFKQLKEDKNFRSLGVLVDSGHTTDSTLKEFCDSVTTVSKLADVSNATSELNRSIFAAL